MRRVTAAGKLRSRPHIRDHEQMVEDELKRQEEHGYGWVRHKTSTTPGISANGKPCLRIRFPQELELPTRPPAAVAPLPRPRSSIGSRSSAGATRRTRTSSRDGPDDDPHLDEPPSWWRNTADELPAGFLDDEEAYGR